MTSLVYSNSNSMTMALSLVLFIWMMATLPGFECSPFDGKVIGEPAVDGDHFFLGAFGWWQQDKNHAEAGFHFKCSVIVIDQKTVLTHAQQICYRLKDGKADYNPALYAVAVGLRKRPNTDGWIKEEDSRGGQGILVKEIHPHPCFKEGEEKYFNQHNIAILKLDKFITYKGTLNGVLTVFPLVLPYYDELKEHISMGSQVSMYGWDDKSKEVGQLKTAIIPYKECKNSGYSKDFINENSFCTRESQKGACKFDGGTAVVGRRKSGQRVLLGMVNMVQKNCSAGDRKDNLPDIHLDLTKYGCSIYENWKHVTTYQCTNSNGDCSEPEPTNKYDPSSTRIPVTNWTITIEPVLPSEVTATTGPDGNTLPTFSTTNEPTDKTTGGGEVPVPAGRAGHMEIPIFGIFAATLAVIISNNNY